MDINIAYWSQVKSYCIVHRFHLSCSYDCRNVKNEIMAFLLKSITWMHTCYCSVQCMVLQLTCLFWTNSLFTICVDPSDSPALQFTMIKPTAQLHFSTWQIMITFSCMQLLSEFASTGWSVSCSWFQIICKPYNREPQCSQYYMPVHASSFSICLWLPYDNIVKNVHQFPQKYFLYAILITRWHRKLWNSNLNLYQTQEWQYLHFNHVRLSVWKNIQSSCCVKNSKYTEQFCKSIIDRSQALTCPEISKLSWNFHELSRLPWCPGMLNRSLVIKKLWLEG